MFPFSLDQTLIIAYFLVTLVFGFYKKSEKDINSFLFAGRKLTLPALVATLVSTWYGGILEIGRFSYQNGIVTWIIFGCFYYIAAFLFVKFIVPKIIHSKIPTIPDLFNNTFGKWPAFISIICVLLMATPAPYLKILADLLNHIWDIPKIGGLCIGATLTLSYAFTGGFSAIVRTDKFQFILMFMGFALILSTSYLQYGGIPFLIKNTPNYAFQIPGNFNWMYICVWGFIALITFIDPSFYQRTFSGNSLKTVQRGILVSVLFWILFDFMTVFTGIYALAILPIESQNPYLDLAQHILPPLGQGLFIVSLFAIVMSTIDSFSFISAFTIGKNLIPLLVNTKDEKTILNYTKWGLGITILASITLAMLFEHVVDIWYMVGSFTVPTLLIPLIAGLYNIKLKNTFIIMSIPMLTSIIWYLCGKMNQSINIFTILDPMYPGILISLILYLININHQHHHKAL